MQPTELKQLPDWLLEQLPLYLVPVPTLMLAKKFRLLRLPVV